MLPRVSGNMDAWWLGAAEFEAVANQILKKLRELSGVPTNGGERIVGDCGSILLNGDFEAEERVVEDGSDICGSEGLALGSHARVGEEIIEQRLHTPHTVHGELDELVGV